MKTLMDEMNSKLSLSRRTSSHNRAIKSCTSLLTAFKEELASYAFMDMVAGAIEECSNEHGNMYDWEYAAKAAVQRVIERIG